LALILNIETTTTNCSVALSENGQTLDCLEDRSGDYSHAEKLHAFIKQVLENNQKDFSDLSAVSVSKGPGSYTGLRIGVSAAKGLCFSLDIPLISIPTAQVYQQQVVLENKGVVVLMNSRKNEVYAAEFDAKGKCQRNVYTEILTASSYRDKLTADVIFIGNGVTKLSEIAGSEFHLEAQVIDSLPSAKEMSLLAEQKHKKSDTEDVAYFEPEYLKPVWAKKLKS
jgi:tRNA threonylcarbamoyladenosine biosynthesis protein TsaB